MKTTGIVLSALGGLMILGSVKVALTKYDLSDGHDLNKLIGGASMALLLLAVGLTLIKKSRKNQSATK